MNIKKQPIRISLDLETMSLENNAAIIQIGACVIGELDHPNRISLYIDPKNAERYGHVDAGTMDWWSKQDASVREVVFGGQLDTPTALNMFQQWCVSQCEGDLSNLRIYAKGNKDLIWLESAYYADQGRWPFHYRSPADLRTLTDLMVAANLEMPDCKPDRAHDALSDAIAQAHNIEYILFHVSHI